MLRSSFHFRMAVNSAQKMGEVRWELANHNVPRCEQAAPWLLIGQHDERDHIFFRVEGITKGAVHMPHAKDAHAEDGIQTISIHIYIYI